MIYFDNSANSKCKYFASDYYVFGNPNSVHGVGRKAHEALEEARARIKRSLGVKSGKIIMGGTASQLIEAMHNKGEWDNTRVFGSAYEHDSIDKFVNQRLKSIDEAKKALEVTHKYNDPIFVYWMLTQNLTGTIYDVKSIGELCHKYGAYYIMDCTASVGHNSIPDGVENYCDCLVTSAHKYHGPTGQGFMWISDRFSEFLGLTDDDHEEYGLIPGTPDVSGAVAMSFAFEDAVNSFKSSKAYEHFSRLLTQLMVGLEESGLRFQFVDPYSTDYTPAINAIYFPDINADALVQYLSSKDVYISAGHSACSSDSPDASRVLEAFGLSKEEAAHVVRISFCEDNTEQEVDKLVEEIVNFKKMFC